MAGTREDGISALTPYFLMLFGTTWDNPEQLSGGEGGIRTLGPPQEGQRFSRPPRSTAPAPLQLSGGKELARSLEEQQENKIGNWHRIGTGTSYVGELAPPIAASIASAAAVSLLANRWA